MIRNRAAVTAIFAGILTALSFGCRNANSDAAKLATATSSVAIQHLFEAGLDSLIETFAQFDSIAQSGSRDALRVAFRNSRRAYKLQETLLSENGPNAAGVLNGPLPEDDDGPPQPLGQPAAFQRIEALVFGNDSLTLSQRSEIRYDISTMRNSVAALRALTAHFGLTEAHVLNAMRTELARITILGFADFDSDQSGDSMTEASYALAGMETLSAVASKVFSHTALWSALRDTLQVATQFLQSDNTSRSTDRLHFISAHGAAVGRNINRLRLVSQAVDTTLRAVWRSSAGTVYERNAFDATAYAPAFAMRPTPELVALGERLFHDTKLSGPGTRACATCHVQALAFTDGQPRNQAIGSRRVLSRNTPTLLNVALQPSFFADGSATTLEDQIRTVLASPLEMATSAESAAQRISTDSSYRSAFVRAGASVDNSQISEAALRSVLATYVRSLVKLNSRFDLAVQGDSNAITPEERRGFNVFMGKGRCGTCHFAPLFSGVTPPAYLLADPEIIGVPVRPDTIKAVIDPDAGRAGIDSMEMHRHAFNVPTLRNIARTAPYMHNGAYATLEQVIDFYNRGGGIGIGARVPGQTLSSQPLQLSAQEQRELIAFLKSLTDRAFEN